MAVIGALSAAACAALLILVTREPSRVAVRLAALHPSGATILQRLGRVSLTAPSAIRASGIDLTSEQLGALKVVCGIAGALIAALATAILPVGPFALAAAAYCGFITPSLVVERRASDGRREAERAVASYVEWAHTLAASGRPVDSALIALAKRGTGAMLVDDVLRRVDELYTLGAPLYTSLSRESRDAGLASLAQVSDRLERSREFGQGSLRVLEDARDELRAAAQDRLVQAASYVEGKMTLILTVCYLPALALLVVVPMFLTLLAGLFG